MADKLGDLQVADFTNKQLKKKLVHKKHELEEEQKFTDDTIEEANKKIGEMKAKLDKRKAEVKQLKKDRDTMFVGIKRRDRKLV